MKWISFIAASLLTACAAQPSVTKRLSVTKPAIPYVAKFEKLTGLNVESLRVEFVDLRIGEIGRCTVWEDQRPPRIQLDPQFWMNATATQREQLMLHELGHCVLRKEHNDDEPGIMNTNHLPDDYYVNNRTRLIKEYLR